MAKSDIRVNVVIENEATLMRLEEAIQMVADAAADSPWRTELAEALEHLQYVTQHLECLVDDDDDELEALGCCEVDCCGTPCVIEFDTDTGETIQMDGVLLDEPDEDDDDGWTPEHN